MNGLYIIWGHFLGDSESEEMVLVASLQAPL